MRRTAVLTMGIVGFMVVALGVAWGCTVQAGITSVSPDSPYPGDAITVTGNEYHANATIQLHWGKGGPVIGSSTADESGVFTATGTIPESAEPGEQLVVAKDPDVSTPGHGEASVMVSVAGEQPEPAPEPEAAEDPEPAQESTEEAPEPEPAEQAAPSAPEGERQQVGGESEQVGERQHVGAEPQPAGDERQQVGATAPSADEATAEPAPTAPAAPADPAPAEAAPAPAEESAEREASVETSGPVSLGPDQVARGSAAAEPEAAPSERSAGGDLWSGVAPSEAPSLTPEAGYDSAAEAGQTGPGQLAVGLALFGAGLTVLLAGAGVPALRRRRAVVHARATRSE